MTLKTDNVQQSCRMIARQMRDYSRSLNLSFIIHHAGQRLETLSMAGQELLSHPAGDAALRLMRTPKKNENSGFMGLVAWRENILIGLASRRKVMALTTLNMDQFDSLRDIRLQAWHMAWHAIDLYNQRNDPSYENDYQEGLIMPRVEGHNSAGANLRADVFSAVMCGLNGDKDTIRQLANARSMDALTRNAGHRPEYYPFALAMEATQMALSELMRRPPSKKRQINAALKLAENIGQTYDEITLQQWIYFCKPAQDMAWRGDDKETILGAAVSTSQDTFIRATGFLVAEITRILPASILTLDNHFSPFAEDRYNQRLHEGMMERAFQKAVATGLSEHSGEAFLAVANEQNQKLPDGHILGWCAAALQAAGRAFETALASGSKTPEEFARREFEGSKGKTTWDSLKEVGQSIIEQYRHGYAVTFSDLIEFAGDRPAFSGISSSISVTMKDPNYLKKMEIANDLSPKNIPQPTAPAPTGPATPSAAPRLNIPGLGLGGSSGVRQATAPPPAVKKDNEENRE